jgi:hypothetical protein
MHSLQNCFLYAYNMKPFSLIYYLHQMAGTYHYDTHTKRLKINNIDYTAQLIPNIIHEYRPPVKWLTVNTTFLQDGEIPDSVIGCTLRHSTIESLDHLPSNIKFLDINGLIVAKTSYMALNYLPFQLQYFVLPTIMYHYSYMPLNLVTFIIRNVTMISGLHITNLPHKIAQCAAYNYNCKWYWQAREIPTHAKAVLTHRTCKRTSLAKWKTIFSTYHRATIHRLLRNCLIFTNI